MNPKRKNRDMKKKEILLMIVICSVFVLALPTIYSVPYQLSDTGIEINKAEHLDENRNFILDVYDTGKAMDQSCLKKANISSFENDPNDLDNIPESGRGLAVIKETMDSMTYETKDGKNCFTMTKKLQD